MTPRSLVLAEVEELATNQARQCSVCRQRVRFLSKRLASSESRPWRCSTCSCSSWLRS